MGNRIYGCDDCLAVCPWNKFAQAATRPSLPPAPRWRRPHSTNSLGSTTRAFRKLFARTAVKRTGRDRFVRNVLIAIGNSGQPALAIHAERLMDDPAPIVRGAAVWAAARLRPQAEFAALAARRRDAETDASVREEWTAALEGATS